MKFRDRRQIESDIRDCRHLVVKMERALEETYERIRKLEQELDADNQPAREARS